MKSLETHFSDTAEVAAGYRATAHEEIPTSNLGSDNLAKYFIRSSHQFLINFGIIRKLGIRKSGRFTPGGFEYVLARTAYFDHQLLDAIDAGAKQVVILGAGFDSRALRFFKQCSQCNIFELDFSPMQVRKKECLQKANIAVPKNLNFVPINLDVEPIENTLGKVGYDSSLRTVFLWEGVSMYLNRESVDSTLRFVGENKNPNSVVIFDYIASIKETDRHKLFGVDKWINTWNKYRNEEPFKTTLPDEELHSYLSILNLEVKSFLKDQDIQEEFVPLGKYKGLGRVTGWFRFVVASPKNET